MIKRKIQDPSKFGKVAIVYGGNSSDREISLWSGRAILHALKQQEIDAHGIDFSEVDLLNHLITEHFDRVFIILDRYEGRTLQQTLEQLKIPYIECGLFIVKPPQLTDYDDYFYDDEDAYEELEVFLDMHVDQKNVNEFNFGVTQLSPSAVDENYFEGLNDKVFAKWGREEESSIMPSLMIERMDSPLHKKYRPFFSEKVQLGPDLTFCDKYCLKNNGYFFTGSSLDDIDEIRYQMLTEKFLQALDIYGWQKNDFLLETDNEWALAVDQTSKISEQSFISLATKQTDIAFGELCWLLLETSLKDAVINE